MNLTRHIPGDICRPRFRSFLIPLLRTRLAQIRVLLLFLFRNASLIFASVLFVCTSFPQAQKKDTTIRVRTDVIAVNARVTDKHDREVPGLTADDFSLFEDGKRQQISFFETEKAPIAISILVDSSSSMNAGDKFGTAQRILQELVSGSRPEDDVSILQFTDHVVDFRQITQGERGLNIPVGIKSESGGTAIYDALASAICHLRTSKNLRQAIVIITDGADQRSRLKLGQLIRLVQSSRAQLFIIGFYDEPAYVVYAHSDKTVTLVTGQQVDNPVVVFDQLAKESGAEAFFPTTKQGREAAVRKILNTLRAQYTLAYYPEGSAKTFRRVQVKLNRGGFKIRARERVTRPDPADEGVRFEPDNCEVSAKAHPYPYEARVTESGGTLKYWEDFSDPQTGWPNHPGSRYVSGGYELSLPAQLSNVALAAYGPWWDKLRASVYVDAGWAPNQLGSQQLQQFLDPSSAGIVFRLRDVGYYAFLLNTNPGTFRADHLSFKLVRRTYGGNSEFVIVPWTRLSAKQLQREIKKGIKLTVQCQDDEIDLFVDDQQVAHVRDASYDSGYIGLISIRTDRVIFRDLNVEGTR
jgi:VWFA-related protein